MNTLSTNYRKLAWPRKALPSDADNLIKLQSNACLVFADVAKTVTERHDKLDLLANKTSIFRTPECITRDGLDVSFAVNRIAPYPR